MRTRKTLRPGSPGTKALLQEYGDRLVCVRYRYDDRRRIRLKTVELVVEEIEYPEATDATPVCAPNAAPPPSSVPEKATPHTRGVTGHREGDHVSLEVGWDERRIHRELKAAGGRWDPRTRSWKVARTAVMRLNLAHRIIKE